MAPVKLTEADVWGAYWRTVGEPQDEMAALRWWRQPGALPENADLSAFRTFAPRAVKEVIRHCGLPRSWFDSDAAPGRRDVA